MFCFSTTCRICKCTTNPFTLPPNLQNEWSTLFFNMFPELMNAKLNNFLKNVCTLCVEQLKLFVNFKNHCIQSDQRFLHYLSQLEGHDHMHGELVCQLDIKQDDCSNDDTLMKSSLENHYDLAIPSSTITENFEIDIVKHEICIADKDESSNSIVSSVNNKESIGIIGTKQEFCLKKDDLIQEKDNNKHSQRIYNFLHVEVKSEITAEEDTPEIAINDRPHIDEIFKASSLPESQETVNKHKNYFNTHAIENPNESEEKISIEFNFIKNTGENIYICSICKKSCSETNYIIKHNRLYTGEQPFVCDLCEKAFRLKTLQNTHTEQKPYECDICKKSFSIRTSLKRHKKMHTGERPYVCDICKKAFVQKANMIVHKRTHTGEKPFECDMCRKSFSQKIALINHQKQHTGERPYVCNICEKGFLSKFYLTEHKRTHTGEKPYVCDVCEKAFVQKSHMIVHKRTHTGEKPYECDVCKKSFSYKNNLITHKRIHTDEKL